MPSSLEPDCEGISPVMASAARQLEDHRRPNLLTIPRELIDMTIAPFLQSGELSVSSICPTITEEALERINHVAKYRINLNISGRKITNVRRANVPAGIKNVDIRLRLPSDRNIGLEDAFRLSSIRHLSYRNNGDMDHCTFTIEYEGGELSDKQMKKYWEIRHFGNLLLSILYYVFSEYTHFNILVVKVIDQTQDIAYRSASPQQRLCLCLDALNVQLLKRKLVPG